MHDVPAIGTVATACPDFFNFGAEVVDHIARTADGPALIWASAEGGEAHYRFSDIARLSAQLASAMATAEIAKGDRVIVMLPRIPEWQIAMVACLKLGAVPVPCVEMLTAKDVADRVARSGARTVITRASHIPKFDSVADRILLCIAVGDAPGSEKFHALLETGDPDFVPALVAADDPAVLYFTSGSTGQPKGVLHAARALCFWRNSAVEWLNLGRGDIIWCTADTGWSKAGTSILFGPWSCGACVLFYDGPFDPAARLALIERFGVTVYCATNTELARVLDADVARFDLSRLRRTVTAGEALSPVVADRWLDKVGHRIAESYGQTETLMTIGMSPGAQYKPGSTGRALPGNLVAVIDEAGRPMPPGEEGDLALRLPNPQLMLGYWEDAERTTACFRDGTNGQWFVTGDRGFADSEGYFFHRGRSDDVINSAGYRIGPGEVEDALLAHPAVAEAAAVGVPDAARGEVVAAFVVLRSGHSASAALEREIQDSVKATTAPYKYPRIVRFVTEFPRTPTGKLQRNVLRAWARAERIQ